MDAVGFGIIMPVLPQLVMEVGRIDLPRAIEVGAWIGLVMAVATFLASPVLGNLSDHFGRRRILLLALGGLAVDYVLLTIIETLPWLFVARALSGIFGGSYAAAQAAIADITAPRSAPAISALLAQHSVSVSLPAPRSAVSWARSARAPFVAAAILAAANMLYGYFIFPETLPANGAGRSTGGVPTRSARGERCARCPEWTASPGCSCCGRSPASSIR